MALGSRKLSDKFVILANTFLAWHELLPEESDSRFPVDDLDSLTITTPQLAKLLHAANEPVAVAMILSLLSAQQVVTVLSELVSLDDNRSDAPYNRITASILWALVLVPSTGSHFGELLLNGSLSDGSLAKPVKTILDNVATQKNLVADTHAPQHLVKLGFSPSSCAWLAEAFTFDDSSKRAANSNSMDIDADESRQTPKFVQCREMCSAVIDCALHEESVSLSAWKLLLSSTGARDVDEVLNLASLIDNFLLPIYARTQSHYSCKDKLDLIRLLAEMKDLIPSEQEMIFDCLKALLLADWQGETVNEALSWRLSSYPSLLNSASLAKHGVTATLNSITDALDEDIVQELIWLSFLNPEPLLQHLAKEMTHKKDAALRLGPYLAKLPMPLLPLGPHSLLFKSLMSSINAVDADARQFTAHSSAVLQTLDTLYLIKHETSSCPLLDPIDVAYEVGMPLLEKVLQIARVTQVGSFPRNNIASILPSCHSLLLWILELLSGSIAATIEINLQFDTKDAKARDLMEHVLEIDMRLQASPWVHPSLPSLLGLVESILRRFATLGLTPFNLSVDAQPASQSRTSPLSRTIYPWNTLIKCSPLVLPSSQTSEPASDGGFSDQHFGFLPSDLSVLLTSGSLNSLETPGSALDLVYASSSGGIVAGKIAHCLRHATVDPLEAKRHLRQVSVSCALILPRLSLQGFESVFTHLMLPLSTWTEFQGLLSLTCPAFVSPPLPPEGAERSPPTELRAEALETGNGAGDVAPSVSEVGAFLAAFSFVSDLLVALILNKNNLGDACFGVNWLTEVQASTGVISGGQVWLELVGKLLHVAIQFLGLGSSKPLHTDPWPLLSLLHILLSRLCLPIVAQMPMELRNGGFSMSRLGIFFSMLTAESWVYSTQPSWARSDTRAMCRLIKADCAELGAQCQGPSRAASLQLADLALLWTANNG